MGLGQTSSVYCEILAENEHQTPIHCTLSRHHTITRKALHAEIYAAVLYEHVVFLEASGIQEQLDALSRSEFAFLVLLRNARSAPAVDRLATLVFNAFMDGLVWFGSPLENG